MSEERDRLNREHAKATLELIRLRDLRDEFIRDERRKIDEQAKASWGEQIRVATQRSNETRLAREAEDARLMSENPLVGQRVVKKKYGSYGYRCTDKGNEFGVIEVMTHSTEVADNLRHSKPSVGDLFVRLLKSDGTPSKRVDRYNSNWNRIEESALIP